ncbi:MULTISPECIES: hypothetical protein [Nocardia]|uniref:hypothetical protein n=1 Tax=Nocardia TaxID=1817 RepID=UPI000D69B726|nr:MULTISPECIES: hypothetical protein [Nocardia]
MPRDADAFADDTFGVVVMTKPDRDAGFVVVQVYSFRGIAVLAVVGCGERIPLARSRFGIVAAIDGKRILAG